jgi:hypothetical protein
MKKTRVLDGFSYLLDMQKIAVISEQMFVNVF